ncbi:hypothetical protein ElyMa_003953100 [Elysia marginata]|uniref:Uncharacterized protein n=1 Tax=Elysia marginata TaxID=1093978 RepID=A0AAV4FX24_9GAST|nr:hypothetical protein ElyMa_003953100 [Elysia marginata]
MDMIGHETNCVSSTSLAWLGRCLVSTLHQPKSHEWNSGDVSLTSDRWKLPLVLLLGAVRADCLVSLNGPGNRHRSRDYLTSVHPLPGRDPEMSHVGWAGARGRREAHLGSQRCLARQPGQWSTVTDTAGGRHRNGDGAKKDAQTTRATTTYTGETNAWMD